MNTLAFLLANPKPFPVSNARFVTQETQEDLVHPAQDDSEPKFCGKCKTWKTAGDFYKVDGRAKSPCKICHCNKANECRVKRVEKTKEKR